MKILHVKDFKGEWLYSRFFLCYLPTEIVIPSPYTGQFNIPPLDRVYGYSLPIKDFPAKQFDRETKYGIIKGHARQIAIEIYGDHASDGHVYYEFENKFAIIYNNEIEDVSKFTLNHYKNLTDQVYARERLDNEAAIKQLTFNNLRDPWHYNYDHNYR